MTWIPLGESTTDPDTGYEIPGTPGDEKSVPCRFRLEALKEFKGQDGKVTSQVGQIRVDVGSELPEVGQIVTIPGYFQGVIQDIYKGQLTWRLDV